ncbi:uv-damaged dna-binding protein [Sarocladium implicatum]|nr:uv-damaged dna-binding protein [Sarocladium implicatum]
MAIFSAVPPPPELASTPPRTTKTPTRATTTSPPAAATPPPAGYVFPSPANTRATPIDIDAWTIHALESLSVSPLARGTRSPLSINIDEQRKQRARTVPQDGIEEKQERVTRVYIEEDEKVDLQRDPIRRPPSRRDSQRKREMLLKGKEGSRQRRRWENDRLMHVPNAQPPAPSDWHPHPTHPIHHIPYALASYWDQTHHTHLVTSKPSSFQKRNLERTSAQQAASKRVQLLRGTATGLGAGEVPRDLREAAKRSQVVKGWVKDLEGPIREWVRGERSRQEDQEDGVESDEEEIVFVGRRGKGDADAREEEKSQRRDDAAAAMVLDSFGDVENASYKRWLSHSISAYYGLHSHSIVLQNPTRKVVCVGLKQTKRGKATVSVTHLPRPLWEICC